MRISGAVERALELTLADLRALGLQHQEHVLDCTGGWAMRTMWTGVPMSVLLDAVGVDVSTSTIDVSSVTGWGARMQLEEARATLLATGVGGTDLPAANGAPLRLVVPNRRGLDWVRWVDQIVVS